MSNVGISPQTFLTFNFDPFSILLLNITAMLSTSRRLLKSNQGHLPKIFFQGLGGDKTEVMIASPIEMPLLLTVRYKLRQAMEFCW